MSGAKHTPGPWRHEPTNGAKLTYVAVSTVAGSNGNTVVIGQCAGPDKEANARLIASAPDLLEALEGLVAIAAPNIYPQPDKPDSAWAKLQAARAAIAKATGADQ